MWQLARYVAKVSQAARQMSFASAARQDEVGRQDMVSSCIHFDAGLCTALQININPKNSQNRPSCW
jgi:hypothetical protein